MTTPDIRLVTKTDDETARWLPVAMAAYEQARRDAGDGPEQAEAARRLSQEQFFPDGRLIDGHFLFTVVDGDGDDVGWLWIGPVDGASTWYVWDVEVHEAHRGRGLGRATMRLAEDFARSTEPLAATEPLRAPCACASPRCRSRGSRRVAPPARCRRTR